MSMRRDISFDYENRQQIIPNNSGTAPISARRLGAHR
jgi:hypothetical protein